MESIHNSKNINTVSPEIVMLRRTKQIIWLVLFALVGNLVIVLSRGEFYQAALVSFLILSMIAAARLASKESFKVAAIIVIYVLTFGILAVLWSSGGLYDIALLAIPGISIFAAMLGMTKINSTV